MDVYKANIQYGGSLDSLKLITVVIGDLHNKEIIEDPRDPTASMRTLNYFFVDN